MMESITASSNLVASQMGVLTEQQVQQSTDSIVSSLALQIRAAQADLISITGSGSDQTTGFGRIRICNPAINYILFS